MKLELGQIHIVEVRDPVTHKRTAYFGMVEYRGNNMVYIGGHFCRFSCGWIDEEEIEWASAPYPRPEAEQTEREWFLANFDANQWPT